MLRVYLWPVGLIALVLLLVFAVRPEARVRGPQMQFAAAPVSPTAPLILEGCTTAGDREQYEQLDCLQSVRLAMLEGTIDLAEAIRRLEACAAAREDLSGLVTRSAQLRVDMLRASLAFGETLAPGQIAAYETLAARFPDARHSLPDASVQRLRAAGIEAKGIDLDRADAILNRLRSDGSLRADFRAVFGDLRANDLDTLLDPSSNGTPTALVIGSTTLIPNLPPVHPAPDGGVSVDTTTAPVARAVSSNEYAQLLASDLTELEVARLRYLASAGRLNQRIGSARVFLASIKAWGEEDLERADLEQQVARDRAALTTMWLNLERTLGADPLVNRMAGESVGLAVEIGRKCEVVAANRRRWIQTGAGVVTGLVGAAGVVVVTGATGTLLGGVTIAAAVEASLGAYMIARAERIGVEIASSAPVESTIAEVEPELEPYSSLDEEESNSDEGGVGEALSDLEEWFDDIGEAREVASLDGETIEAERGVDSDDPSLAPRRNTIPPVLPIDIPEALRELPPILDTPEIRALKELTLPEIQERLDEFLIGSDPETLSELAEGESVALMSAEEMMEEARVSLRRWENQQVLSDRFGVFFIQAELERLPLDGRGKALRGAMGRYLQDRSHYSGSNEVAELRTRFASRLVTHCRSGAAPGDLVLAACTNETALSILFVAALQDAGVPVPDGSILGVQAFDRRFEAVLYSREHNKVFSLTRGSEMEGVVAPIYHPAVFYYGYLVDHRATPDIDFDKHLLIALPDRPMPAALEMEECVEEKRGVVGRAVEWIGSMIGIVRISNDCGEAEVGRRSSGGGGGSGVTLALPSPRNPVRGGGGGQGGGGGGGGSGGGSPFAPSAPGDPMAGGGASGGEGQAGGQGSSGQGEAGSSEGEGEGSGSGGGAGAGGEAKSGEASNGSEPTGDKPAEAAAGEQAEGTSAESAESGGGSGSGSGTSATGAGGGTGDGAYGVGGAILPTGPSLTGIGRETVRMAELYDRAAALRVEPWRLRDDEGMASGAPGSVLFADNARALERFGPDDLFITLTPAEVEAQRRMLEADSYPLFSAETDCKAADLPPLRVFRRATPGDAGYRYVFCDQDESMVIFRHRADADNYAELSAPDRPLFLARLASERLARFERSAEVQRLNAFLADPNVLSGYSRAEIHGMVKAAADLLVFQDALESALVQSMNELGPSGIRSEYYEMHRQVMQAPFFLDIAEKVYRLNRRLVSDPLQSLAWTNAQKPLTRQGFFDLYFTVGSIMDWPERWATLQSRFGTVDSAAAPTETSGPSLDFLQVLSDPTRVQVDWATERLGNPSIRDRAIQEGTTRTTEEVLEPTLADVVDREDEVKNTRGGTGGLGRAGEGEGLGPEKGRRPLQMIRIRITPDMGQFQRVEPTNDSQSQPGGTEGRERLQTEESASRQEPILWLSPQTFVEAVLSTWDSRDLEPGTAGRIPPILRFNESLREVFLREFKPVAGVYDNRLRAAMETFTLSGWLRYAEVREAMGGSLSSVKAFDLGRFSGAYSGNAPINDQDQIRIPNFFSTSGVVIPADLFEPVREHYTRSVLGIFDLSGEGQVPPAVSLGTLPVPSGDGENARANLLRSLELVREQAAAARAD